jgi:23S rRNA pseudouridine1911/1915/1917 synthase
MFSAYMKRGGLAMGDEVLAAEEAAEAAEAEAEEAAEEAAKAEEEAEAEEAEEAEAAEAEAAAGRAEAETEEAAEETAKTTAASAATPEQTPNTHAVEFVVEHNYAGWCLDRYVGQKLKRLSRMRIQALIRKQLPAPLKPSTRLRPGMRLCFWHTLPEEPSVPAPEALTEVFEDEDLLVLDKPAGLPVHPSARYFHNTLLAQLARRYAPRPSPCALQPFQLPCPAHRLDRETSGLLVCTKNRNASQEMMRAFASSCVHKEYLAIAEGHPPRECFSVNAPIAEGTPSIRIAVRISAEGKPASTQVEVLRRFHRQGSPFCLLKCTPLTGRQHQIRVHLKHLGFPLVGDKIYGPDEMYFDRFSKRCLEPEAMERLRLPRHALHASLLCFKHPRTQKPMRFESALPEDLRGFLEES